MKTEPASIAGSVLHFRFVGRRSIVRREFRAYFATPLAYIFLVIFLVLTGVFTFYLGGFYERGQADLRAFFNYHPWLYLFLVPAIAMRLWAEERKSGTVEQLFTDQGPLDVLVDGQRISLSLVSGIKA